jgi:hypothetical protein
MLRWGGLGGTSLAVLRVASMACFVAGLIPNGQGSAHGWADGTRYRFNLGLPSSPVFRYSRKEIESRSPPTVGAGGLREESSWSSSAVHGWEIRPFTWSGALILSGAVLLAISLRRAGPAAANGPAEVDRPGR